MNNETSNDSLSGGRQKRRKNERRRRKSHRVGRGGSEKLGPCGKDRQDRLLESGTDSTRREVNQVLLSCTRFLSLQVL